MKIIQNNSLHEIDRLVHGIGVLFRLDFLGVGRGASSSTAFFDGSVVGLGGINRSFRIRCNTLLVDSLRFGLSILASSGTLGHLFRASRLFNPNCK